MRQGPSCTLFSLYYYYYYLQTYVSRTIKHLN